MAMFFFYEGGYMQHPFSRNRLVTLAFLLVLVLVGIAPLRSVEAQPRPDRPTPGTPLSIEPVTVTSREDVAVNKKLALSRDGTLASVFLKINSPSLASFMAQNGITSINDPAAQAYLRQLNSELDALIAQAEQRIPGLFVTHRFDLIIGGVSVAAPVSHLDHTASAKRR
jgi:hypothetical protein